MTEPEKLGIGLIGAGRIGRVHAHNLAHRVPDVQIAGIADVFATAAQELARQAGAGYATDDYRRLLDDPDVAAVLICSATDTHAQFITESAQAGKHVFCEKPIDLALEKIDTALAAVEQAGVKFQVGFNRRFDANYARVHRAIDDGEIGAPHLMHIISRDPAPPPISYIRISGGIFLDMTIHDFDMARFLMGCEATEIYATANVLIDPAIGEAGDFDTALIHLRFENGALGVIDNSRRAVYGYDQRVEVLGSLGRIATENNYPNSATLSTSSGVQRDLPYNFFMERYTESYVAELNAFVRAILDDAPTPVDGHDGRMPVLMGLAAQRSVREKRPVRLDEVLASPVA